MNLAALPESLFEAELFGHAKGAYTGALAATLGRIREAGGGTLVLDEIGELPLSLQPKLLRVLEEGCLRPVGASADVPVDVRFVASTNAELADRIGQGTFRADLLARFRGHVVQVPTLRSRVPDLIALADAVHPATVGDGSSRSWGRILTPEAAELVHLYLWKYNCRDLQAMLVRAAALLHEDRAGIHTLPVDLVTEVQAQLAGLPAPTRRPPGAAAAREATDQEAAVAPGRPDPEALHALLARHRGNVDRIAQELGRHRRQVYRWLAYAGIDRDTLAKYRDSDRGDA